MLLPSSFRSRCPLDGVAVLMGLALVYIICVLGLTYEGAFFELLDLKSKKEFQLSHHGHLKSFGHNSTKLINPNLVSRTKYNVIDIYLAHK
jgi:hypothetical protein